MFRIAALGSHRPRAIAEHSDLLRAILERKPEFARTAAPDAARQRANDIRLIRDSALDDEPARAPAATAAERISR